MTVLWILFWILAAILLLLCFPVTLQVSWLYPPKEREKVENASYFTDQVQKDIAEMGLCDEDEQILSRMVGQLPPRRLPPQKELLASLRYLFLNMPLYPMQKKEKPPKPKKEKVQQESEEKQEKPKEKTDWKEFLPDILNAAKKPLGMIVHDVCLHHLRLCVVTVGEDSAQTALDNQKLLTAVYSAIGVVQNIIKIKNVDIQMRPDFYRMGESDWTVCFKISIHPIVVLAAGVRFGVSLIKMLLRQNSGKNKKDLNDVSDSGGKR